MRKRVAASALALLAAALIQVTALANGEGVAVPNGITLDYAAAVKAGQIILIDATMVAGGVPVAGADLHFAIDGVEIRIEQTDGDGVAHFQMRGVLRAGQHSVQVRYNGDRNSSHLRHPMAAYAAGTFTIGQLLLSVQTVPTVPGVDFVLDGNTHFASNEAGLAEVAVNNAGLHSLTAILPQTDPGTRMAFARWSDDQWTLARQIRIQMDTSVDFGIKVSYLTSLRFVDLASNPLDPARVSNVVLSGPNAELVKVSYPYPPVWLSTPLPTKHSGEQGLHITPTPYSVTSASYDLLDVANQGELRFTPTPGGLWEVHLSLFNLRVHAQDAIFHTGISRPVTLIDPNGRAIQSNLDSRGQATFLLGRGLYTAHVAASGISPAAPIALSRSQTAIVPIITPLDLTLIAALAAVALVTLSLAGRHRRHFYMAVDRIRNSSGGVASTRTAGRLRARGMSPFVSNLPAVAEPSVEPVRRAVEPDPQLDAAYAAFTTRSLEGIKPSVLFFDSVAVKIGGEARQGVLVAWGYDGSGKPSLIDIGLGQADRQEDWAAFVQRLAERGLGAPGLVVGGRAERAAGMAVWPESEHQRSAVQYLRAVMDGLPRRSRLRQTVRTRFWSALDQAATAIEAESTLRTLAGELTARHPGAAEALTEDIPALFRYRSYPVRLHKRLRSSTLLERHRDEITGQLRAAEPIDAAGCARLCWAIVEPITTSGGGLRLSAREREHFFRNAGDAGRARLAAGLPS